MVPTVADTVPAEADRWPQRHRRPPRPQTTGIRTARGVRLVSTRRPVRNCAPDFVPREHRLARAHPRNLYIADFLDRRGDAWDAFDGDHDLHGQGVDLLSRYRAAATARIPRYCSRPMLMRSRRIRGAAGAWMNLGGTGFYRVTSIDPERPDLAEARRGVNGSRAWPRVLAGCGIRRRASREAAGDIAGAIQTGSSASASRRRPTRPNGSGFRRSAASLRPEHSRIFDGVSAATVIGDHGLHLGGAAGYEIDRHDLSHGSPPHSVAPTTSEGPHPRRPSRGRGRRGHDPRDHRLQESASSAPMSCCGPTRTAGRSSRSARARGRQPSTTGTATTPQLLHRATAPSVSAGPDSGELGVSSAESGGSEKYCQADHAERQPDGAHHPGGAVQREQQKDVDDRAESREMTKTSRTNSPPRWFLDGAGDHGHSSPS